MPLFGGKKAKKEKAKLSDIIQEVNNASSFVQLGEIESKLESAKLKYNAGELRDVYVALGRKYYQLGDLERAKKYADLGGDRELYIQILKEEKNCDEILDSINRLGETKYGEVLLECYYERGNYDKILDGYKRFFQGSANSKVLYYAMKSSISIGDVEQMEIIKKRAEEMEEKDKYYYLTLGAYHEFMGHYEEAKKLYKAGLKEKSSTEILYALARCEYFLGNYEEAKDILWQLEDVDLGVKAIFSLIYAKEGRVDYALQRVDEILKVDPKNSYALLAKAIIMHEHGIEGADEAVKIVLEKEPYNPIALGIYAESMESKNKEEAKKTYEKLIKLNPENPMAYLGMARLTEGGEREEYLQKVLEIDPNIVEARIMLSERVINEEPEDVLKLLKGVDDPRAHYLLAKVHHNKGEMEDAERLIRKALEKDGKNLKYRFLLAKIIYRNKQEEAEDILRVVLKEEPDNEEAKKLLAFVIANVHPEEALSLLEGFKDKDSMVIKIKIYRKLGRMEEAEEMMEELLKSNLAPEEYLELAKISSDEDAELLLEKVLSLDSENEEAKYMLAKILVGKDPDRALKLMEDLEEEKVAKLRGIAYMFKKKPEEAMEEFQKCSSYDVECLEHLIDMAIELDRGSEVIAEGKKLLKIKESKENLYRVAKLYEGINDEEAMEVYRRIVLLYPEELEALKKLVGYMERKGIKEDIDEYYQKIYELTGDVQVLIKLANMLRERGDYERAYDTYTKILADHPELEDIEDKRDALLIEMGRYTDLIQLADYWISRKGAKAAKGYYLRAMAYMNIGDLEEALKNIEKCVQKSKKSKYMELYAEILYSIGKYQEAYEVIEKITSKTSHTLLLKAKILKEMGRYEDAEKILVSLKKSTESLEIAKELSEIYVHTDRKEEALSYLEEVSRSTDDIDIFVLGTKLGFQVGDYKKALNFINRGIKYDPQNEELWLYKTLVLEHMGEYREALGSVNNLIRIIEKNEYLLLKAKILNELGEHEGAKDILMDLGDMEFMGISAREELARAHYGLGNYRKSKEIYQELGIMHMVAKNLYMMGKYREILNMEGDEPRLMEVKGDAALTMGNGEEAMKYYRLAMERGIKEAKKKLANLYYESGNLNDAYSLYEEIGDEESIIKMAEILNTWGQFAEAAEKYQEYYAMTGDRDAGLRASRIYVKLKNYDKALEILKGMGGEEALKMQAEIHYTLGDYDKAIDSLRNMEKDDFDVLLLLGNIYLAKGQPHRAKEYYLRAYEIRNDDRKLIKSLAKTYELIGELSTSARYYELSEDNEGYKRAEKIYRELGDYTRLKSLYQKRLSKGVDIEAMKSLAEIYLREGNYVEALKLYKEVEKLEFSAEVLTKIGIIYLKLKRFSDAESSLKKALEIGGTEDTYFYLGVLYSEQGKYNLAMEMLSKSGGGERTIKELCRVYIGMGDLEKAIQYGERIVEEINDGESWYLYGLALMHAGLLEQAIKAFKIGEEKGYGGQWGDLGKIYLMLRQYEKALKAVERGEDEESQMVAGLAYAKLGDFANASNKMANVHTGDAFRYLGDIHLLSITKGEITHYPYNYDKDGLKDAVESYKMALKMGTKYTKYGNLHNNLGVAYILRGDVVNGTEHMEISGMDAVNMMGSYLLLKEMDSAKKWIDQEFASLSKDALYWNARGIYNAESEKYDDAMDSFNNALKFSSSEMEKEVITYNRALLLIKLGMYKNALDLLSKLSLREAYLLRSIVYYNLGMFEEGKENISKFEGEDKEGELAYMRAYIEHKIENHELALKYVNRAINKNSKNPQFWLLKGNILMNMNRYREAERAYGVAMHLDKKDEMKVNLAGVFIMNGRFDDAIELLDGIEDDKGIFNLGCAYARKGEYEKASEMFKAYYKKNRDEVGRFNLFLSYLHRGLPPDLNEERKESHGFNLAEFLLTTYNMKLVISPRVKNGKLHYTITVKNTSGNTISPFKLLPILGSGVSMNKEIGPIRPYEEITLEFDTTLSENSLYMDEGMVPGRHVDIEYSIYSSGIGLVEEIKVKNLMKYSLEGIVIEPIEINGYESWTDQVKIDKIYPGEVREIKIPLLVEQDMDKLDDLYEKYDEFKPLFVDPPFSVFIPSYKIMLRIHPFEFDIKIKSVDYDSSKAESLIRKEKRRMLVKNVGEYSEALISISD